MNLNCSICFEDIQNQDICSLECNHQFCKNCIDNILKTNNKKCPNCRKDIHSYLYQNEKYNLIIIQPDNTLSNLHQTRADLLLLANRKLLKYSYCTTFSLLYLFYSYLNFYFYSHNHMNELNQNLDLCNQNYTQIFNELNDDSYNVIIYNYQHSVKCMLSEFSYDKCFNLFNM